MSFSNDQTTTAALLNTLGEEQAAAWAREEQAAAWARFYAIEVDSRPGELEYDRALAAAKRLDAAVAEIVAAAGGRPKSDWPFEPSRTPAATLLDVSPAPLTLARPAQRLQPIDPPCGNVTRQPHFPSGPNANRPRRIPPREAKDARCRPGVGTREQ